MADSGDGDAGNYANEKGIAKQTKQKEGGMRGKERGREDERGGGGGQKRVV